MSKLHMCNASESNSDRRVENCPTRNPTFKVKFNNIEYRVPGRIRGKELKRTFRVTRLRIRIGYLCREVTDADVVDLRNVGDKVHFEEC